MDITTSDFSVWDFITSTPYMYDLPQPNRKERRAMGQGKLKLVKKVRSKQ